MSWKSKERKNNVSPNKHQAYAYANLDDVIDKLNIEITAFTGKFINRKNCSELMRILQKSVNAEISNRKKTVSCNHCVVM